MRLRDEPSHYLTLGYGYKKGRDEKMRPIANNEITIDRMSISDIATLLDLPLETLIHLNINAIRNLVEKYIQMKEAKAAYEGMLTGLK